MKLTDEQIDDALLPVLSRHVMSMYATTGDCERARYRAAYLAGMREAARIAERLTLKAWHNEWDEGFDAGVGACARDIHQAAGDRQ